MVSVVSCRLNRKVPYGCFIMPSTNSDLCLLLMCEIEEVAKNSVQHKKVKIVNNATRNVLLTRCLFVKCSSCCNDSLLRTSLTTVHAYSQCLGQEKLEFN